MSSYGGAPGIKASKLSLYFVQCNTTSLQQELEGIRDFAGIPSHKVAVRLQLFQTPAMLKGSKDHDLLMLDNLMYSDFEEIPEQCNEGCGFIPKEILTRLLGSHVRGKQTMAIQVRLFAPKLGIFKGMLVEKYGITKIQLPPSMMKVGPSQSCTVLETIVLLVKSIFPSKTTAQVSHVLNLNWAEPSLKSFQPDQTLKLSTMITDLWQSQGVPSALIQSYKKSLTHMKEVHHSFLVGVADPTGSIPEGYIFVPGMGVKQCALENLFVT